MDNQISHENFLSLDRQAAAGRLTAGIIHAVNNILGGILGRVDLIMGEPAAKDFMPDLEKLVESCDEGQKLMRNATTMLYALQNKGAVGVMTIFEAVLAILWRIHRRAAITIETRYESGDKVVRNVEQFTQSVYHLLLSVFEVISEVESDKRTMLVRVASTGTSAEITVTLPESKQMPVFDAGWRPSESKDPAGTAYHYWILSQLNEESGGKWNLDQNRNIIQLIWPLETAAGKAIIE
jgi:signal transduction histidine kinase